MIIWLLNLAFIPWIIISVYLWRRLKRLEREHAAELAKRPIGRVISTTLTEEGLTVTGEVWAPEVLKKMGHDMVGVSIDYKPIPTIDTKEKD